MQVTGAGMRVEEAVPRRGTLVWFRASQVNAATLSGLLLALAGMAILLGIITAEALYPATYTTHANEISDLGATRPPDSVILQPSAAIFDVLMIATGCTILAAAGTLHRAFNTRRVTLSVALLGLGVLGVGLFPGNREPFHPLFALLAFSAGGSAAVLSAKVQSGPFRPLSVGAGVISLASLAFGLFGAWTPAYDRLGDGGVERWIAYPVVLWLVAFGGYLMAPGRDAGPAQQP